jgi:hypothetical protein
MYHYEENDETLQMNINKQPKNWREVQCCGKECSYFKDVVSNLTFLKIFFGGTGV